MKNYIQKHNSLMQIFFVFHIQCKYLIQKKILLIKIKLEIKHFVQNLKVEN